MGNKTMRQGNRPALPAIDKRLQTETDAKFWLS
jgi:hypothetical protein